MFFPAVSVLSISNRKNASQVYYSRDAYKNGFEISYTHSVNKGRVHDIYQITGDDKLLVDETIFVSYGAGIPEPEETIGAVFEVLDNGYRIKNLRRIVSKLTMAVGIIANHEFLIYENAEKSRSKKYVATDLFEAQTGIILEIKKVSIFKYWFHKI